MSSPLTTQRVNAIVSSHTMSSSRIRSSNAPRTVSRPSAAGTPSQHASAVELPPYKKPSHPLDQEATRQLRELQGRNLVDVKRHNNQAKDKIRIAAEGVNDMLREHSQYMARRKKKWNAGKSLDDKEEEERSMAKLQDQVNDATTKLELSMRSIIDADMATQRIDETLDWLRQNAPRQLEDEYNTQMTQRATQRQSQMESQPRQNGDGDDNASAAEELDVQTPGPTPLDGSRVSLTGISELFTTRQQQQKDIYTSTSLTARYARNNDYRDFKRIVHDAKHGEEGPALAHEDHWFSEEGSPAHGVTNTQRDFEDDDDIVMSKATFSTKCPLTLRQLNDPITSTKCPHSYEKATMLEYIRVNRAGVTCPVTGCDQVGFRLLYQPGCPSLTFCHVVPH